MLQHEKPEDFVLATGKTTTIREFCNLSFKELGIDIKWDGKGVKEVGIDKSSNKVIISIDPNYYRPTEVDLLIGDASKARKLLNWNPKYDLKSLVKEMVSVDYSSFQKSLKK